MLTGRDTYRLNALIPQAYEIAWTDLDLPPFNIRVPCEGDQYIQLGLGATLPIPYCVLPPQPKRRYLLIQNNSVATGAGGVAPNLYVSFDGPAQTNGLNLFLFPGASLTLNINVPKNAIFLAWGTSTAPVSIAGVLHVGLRDSGP